MDSRVQDVLLLLDADLSTPPRVSLLAASVGLCPSRLEHLFRHELRKSIRAYVRHRRLLSAARMLTRSHERISTIAFRVGYNDVSNFNHAFKKQFGQSPREYRRGSSSSS
jgi:AraC-like DNA-binding protein